MAPRNSKHVFSRSFCGPGNWQQLGWTALLKVCCQTAAQSSPGRHSSEDSPRGGGLSTAARGSQAVLAAGRRPPLQPRGCLHRTPWVSVLATWRERAAPPPQGPLRPHKSHVILSAKSYSVLEGTAQGHCRYQEGGLTGHHLGGWPSLAFRNPCQTDDPALGIVFQNH